MKRRGFLKTLGSAIVLGFTNCVPCWGQGGCRVRERHEWVSIGPFTDSDGNLWAGGIRRLPA